jgi:adenine-specific DNA-methyltransferase
MSTTSAKESSIDFDEKVNANNLPEHVDFFRFDASRKLDSVRRSSMGQFLTPSSVARLMASMFNKIPQDMKILDAGAGIGSLSAALVAEICHRNERPNSISVTAYEIEPMLVEYLRLTFGEMVKVCTHNNILFQGEILQEDFISAGVSMSHHSFIPKSCKRFNCAILNPPYHKISNNSRERQILKAIGIETGNIYSAFMWLVVKLLESEGELVAIIPRSFCNGPYFLPFRKAFLKSMTLKRIHIFESRREAFHDDDVLQENIIIHAVKSDEKNSTVIISSSNGLDDEYLSMRDVNYDQVVHPDDPDKVVRIIPDEIAQKVSEKMNIFESSLKDLNLEISTGRVVDFRSRELLMHHGDNEAVPLIYPAHFSGGYVEWPIQRLKKPDAISRIADKHNLLVPTDYYVLVKRFSSKEEPKRIVAAIYDPIRISSNLVGFENHINYYHRNDKGMPVLLAKGLALFLNSTLVDQYFRQFSGHTQVNAKDLKSLKYPSEEKLLALGSKIDDTFPSQEKLDLIVSNELGINSEDIDMVDPIKAKTRIEEAIHILKALNLTKNLQNDRSALTLLALCGMKADMQWFEASSPLLGITEMMECFKEHFGKSYKPNTRETVRKHSIQYFVLAGIAIPNPDISRPPNSQDFCYQIDESTLGLIKTYGTNEWEPNLRAYLKAAEPRKRLLGIERDMERVPLLLPDGREFKMAPGAHSELIKDIVEGFCERYIPNGIIVYVDDTGPKRKEDAIEYFNTNLGIVLDEHGKIPDVIVHDPNRNWVVLIEAVTSSGTIDVKRHKELSDIFKCPGIGLIFVTAFPDRYALSRYIPNIAWETEVWVAESPTHIIHFNGERFLGPYQ